MCPYIGGHQLVCVIDALHSDLPLADEGEVERVGGDEEQIWNTKQIKYQPIYLTRVCLCVFSLLPISSGFLLQVS